jgi:hypothetical protein
MHSIVDSIMGPLLMWLTQIYDRIRELSVPLGRPLDLGKYFGYFVVLGPQWMMLITQVAFMAFVYLIILDLFGNSKT